MFCVGRILISRFAQPCTGVCKEAEIAVYLDGERLEFDVPPMIIDGRTMVPMRVIFEALGLTIQWRPNAQIITVWEEADFIGALNVTFQIDNPEVRVETLRSFTGSGPEDEPVTQAYEFDRNLVMLDVPPQIVNNHTLVPLRAVSEILRAVVEWDGDTRTVYILT